MGDARSHFRQGLEHFASQRYAEAIACYRRALELDPRLALAWNGLAMAQAGSGDLDAALESARRVVELEPDEPLGYTSLSILYQRKGLIPEAEEEKARAMRLQMKKRG